MSGAPFDNVDLERHIRWLRRSRAAAVAVCDETGQVVASWDGDGATGIAALLEELGDAAHDPRARGREPRRVELGEGRALLLAPLEGGGDPRGWLAALQEGEQVEALDEPLRDVAQSISVELRLQEEIQGLVGDLTARHEELNLVYDFDARSRAFQGDDAGAASILGSFAAHLQVEVAALVLGDRPAPIHSGGGGGRLLDLDLLLTQLRGDVYRFVSVSRQPLVLNRSDDPQRAYVFANLPYRLLACPVFYGPQPAMLALVRREDGEEFSNSDRNLASMLAGQAAILLQNRGMLTRLETFSAQMAAALIEAVEAKDPYTRGHSERVQRIAVDLGRAVSLAARDLEAVSWGALLHDVGKIGVPDQILCKRGPLTKDEYTLVKIHPERSYEILRHIDGLNGGALAAARYHQEKYDGSGYPHGLSGNQIPTEARVVSVADCYDAITSSRSYRAGLGHDVAVERIRRASGSQLDPWLVDVFLRLCGSSPAWIVRSASDAIDDD